MKWSSSAMYENQLLAHPSVRQHRLCQLPGVRETQETGELHLSNNLAYFTLTYDYINYDPFNIYFDIFINSSTSPIIWPT